MLQKKILKENLSLTRYRVERRWKIKLYLIVLKIKKSYKAFKIWSY